MGKLEYFKELEYRLRGLPERERQNIIAVYEELFQKAEANGKSESSIIESLGFPRVPNWDALHTPGAGPQGGAAGGAVAGYGAAPHAGAAGQTAAPGPAASGYAAPGSAASGYAASGPAASGHAVPGSAASGYAAPGSAAPGYAAPGNAAHGGFGGGYAADPQRPPADPLRDPRAGFTPPVPPVPPLYHEPGFAPPPYRAPVSSGVKPWIAGLALCFFNCVFILGPFLGFCGTLIGLWAAAVALVLTPLLALVPMLGFGGSFSHGTPAFLLSVFGSLASFGAGLMLTVVLQFVTKWFFKLTYKYIQFNLTMIKGA